MKVFTLRSEKLFFIVRIIFLSLKVFGLAPFSVAMKNSAQVNPRNPRIQVFRGSKIGLAYNLLLLIPVLYIAVFDLSISFSSNMWSNPLGIDFRFVMGIVDKILTTITVSIILIFWGVWQEQSASILNRLLEIDVQLARLEWPPFNIQSLLSLSAHVIVNVVIWITLWSIEIMRNGIHSVVTIFLHLLPPAIMYWYFIEYATVVSLVATELQTVNNNLLNFQKFASHLSRERIRDGHLVVADFQSQHSNHLAFLKLLHNLRTILCDLCDDIDDFFSLPILFCVARSFFVLLYRLYDLIVAQGSRSSSKGLKIRKISFICLSVYSIMSLAFGVARALGETRRTSQIIYKLLAKGVRPEIREEIEELSLQLLHESVTFTAYGLFTLDSPLLQSMLSGLATYLLISMQLVIPCSDFDDYD